MDLSVKRQLERVRTRVRVLVGMYGLGWLLAALVMSVVGVVGLDYVLNLRAWPRVVVMGVAVVGVLWVVWSYLLRPLVSRLTLGDVAGRVEAAFPEFEDRLRSVVEFEARAVEGVESDSLRQRVRDEAGRMILGKDLTRAVDGKPAKRQLAWGVGLVAAGLVVGLLVPGEYRGAAVDRITSPFAGTAWPKWTNIAVMTELPGRVPAGERVAVRAKLTKGDKPSARATVFYQYGDGQVRSELMSRGEDGTYSASLDARLESEEAGELKVWVKAGDDEKQVGKLAVVPRLAVRKVVAEVVPPEYARAARGGGNAGGGNLEYDLTRGGIGVVEGSEVRLKLEFNKPLSGVPKLVAVGEEVAGLSKEEGSYQGSAAQLRLALEKSLRFRLSATDTDHFGLAGSAGGGAEYEVLVRPDQTPSIQIEMPRRNEERTAVASVPLVGVAEDDFAVTDTVLRVRRIGDGRVWAVPLVEAGRGVNAADWTEANSTPERVRMRLMYLWELGKLENANLQPGDVLEYFLEAKDNYRRVVAGGEVLEHAPVTSSRLRIVIVSQDQLAAKVTEELRGAAEQVSRLRTTQQRTSTETQELADESRGKPELDEAQKAQARRLTDQQSVVASQSKQVAGKLEELIARMAENRLEAKELPETARDVKDLLDRAAEGPMKQATSELSQAREAKAAQREQDMKDAREGQKQADRMLGQAQDRLASLGSVRQTMENLKNLLAEQQKVGQETREVGKNNLGKRPEEMSSADRKKLEELTQKQRELAQRTEELLDKMQEQASQMEKSDPQSSEAMKQAAQQGQQQGVSQAQQKASQSMEQNQQTQAQSQQRQAEIGLQTMLNQLQEAEKRKLEELSKKLADIQEQVRMLARRQAGHNLDNLGLRGAIEKLDAAARGQLTELSERDPARLAGGDVAALSTGQEQSERNTRSLSEQAASVQGGGGGMAEIADHLSRAASRMERAAVLIRGKDLAGAYEPPQVEALASLVAAMDKIDEMKKEAEEKAQERQRETIRQAYVEIKAEQEALAKETARIDAIKARAGENLPRQELQKLAQLPGQQGALAERAAKLEEDLVAVGAVVYVWANKDIVEAMGGVKEELAGRNTGKPTQAEQGRVVEQLDAMIRSLTVKPPEKKEFEDRQAGGGGEGGGQQQQQKQRLPSEVELKLLRELQNAVNRGTSAASKAEAADPKSVEKLAQRQADLRKLLGDLLSKASRGQFKLGEEPKRDVKMPEELTGQADAAEQFDRDLLEGEPHGEDANPKSASAVDRMGRSRQRLGDDKDPGAVTQKIQERILLDIDELIQQARQQQQQQQQQQSRSRQRQQGQQNQPGSEQANNQGERNGRQGEQNQQAGTSGANRESVEAGGHKDPTKEGGELAGRMAEWGGVTPRQRQAVIEGSQDTPLEKYRSLIEDYYRSLAERSSQPKN